MQLYKMANQLGKVPHSILVVYIKLVLNHWVVEQGINIGLNVV